METDLSQRMLSGAIPPGIYQVSDTTSLNALAHSLHLAGWDVFLVDGHDVADTDEFFTVTSSAMAFPGYFGHNWNALEDCLKDLNLWTSGRGYVALFTNMETYASANPEDFRLALSIFQAVSRFWAKKSTPFFALLGGMQVGLPEASAPIS